MHDTAYPAARTLAARIVTHFERHLAARRPGEHLSSVLPDAAAVEAIIGAAFWASLRRVEGYVPRISLALLPPSLAAHALLFEHPLPLAPGALVHVAPAVERPGIHLGVWEVDGQLAVWGTTRTIPAFCFVLEVAAPGLLVVKHHRDGAGKFVNVAVVEGDEVKIVDEAATSLPDCPELLASLLGFDGRDPTRGDVDVLVQLAVSMRAHGRGGTLLIVPSASDEWRSSILSPVSYSVRPAFNELGDLLRQRPHEHRREWQEAVDQAVTVVAGLTAVDGATLLTDRYDLLGFGAKIGRRDGFPTVEQVAMTEPIEGTAAIVGSPARLGGTRHLSAAQFVHDQHEGLALVASQDGRFTVFAWSPCENMVYAHRVEALLL